MTNNVYAQLKSMVEDVMMGASKVTWSNKDVKLTVYQCGTIVRVDIKPL